MAKVKLSGYRRLLGLGICALTLIILAMLKAPGEAYTALGLLGGAFFGAAWVEQWSSYKQPGEKSEPKVKPRGE